MKDTYPNRFEAMTGFRAIAAIMVFCFHFRKFWIDHLPVMMGGALNEFHIDVLIFIVLSGFLIAYAYKDAPLHSGIDYLKYIRVRLVRIFPVYLVILTLKYTTGGFPSQEET